MKRRSLAVTAVLAASAFALTACATAIDGGAAADAPVGQSLGSLMPGLPAGDVMAQGTVMDVGGDVQLCLGAIADSYPPRCEGIPVEGWSWDGVGGGESAGDVRWGAYAVQGVYDAAIFTVSRPPIPLALYDPAKPVEPSGGRPGAADEKTLLAIQDELPGRLGASYLGSGPEEGRLHVQVVWDDGTWQKAADDDFGAGVVAIEPALVPIAP